LEISSPGAGRHQRHVMVGTFIHNYRWGFQIRGDERGYLEKAKGYRSLGIELFTLEKPPSIQDGMNERLYTSLKLRDCTVPPRGTRDVILLCLYSLKAAMRRYPSRPLAVYAYNQDIENVLVGYLLKILLGAPLVVIYHQVRPAAFTPFRVGLRSRVQKGFNPGGAVLRSLLPALNRFAANHADTHIALSDATKGDAEKYVGIKGCAVVGNGLDTLKFRPLHMPKTCDATFLGRLAPQKGVDVLLRAWSEVVHGTPEARLVLLGGGDPAEVSLYKSMAKELHLERNVTFAGFVNDEELVRSLNSARLFVFPSRQEGFAQAVSQAMGCGLCCILSDIPSLREVYKDAAVFTPVDDSSALAKAITEMLGATEARERFAVRARQLAEKFSWDDTVRRELAELMKRGAA
jgi:glycosyltransferase involved in cell wall biosynthesis